MVEESLTGTRSRSADRGSTLLGLLPFIGVALYLIAMAITLIGGTEQLVYDATMNAVLFLVGSSALGNGIAHCFFGRPIARSIGWQPGPFQFEVGAANLAIGIAAIVAGSFFGPESWLVVVIVDAVFLILAGAGHIREIVRRHNLSINNAGPILFLDFLIPIVTVGMCAWVLLG